ERTEPGASGRDDRHENAVQPTPEGSFRWEALLPGRHTVVFGLEDDESELARVEDVLVRSGETCEDARLQGFDLRGRLHAIRLLLRAPAGGAALEGEVVFHASEGAAGGAERWHGFHDNPVEL